jgi:phosphoenolpyruvate synthase/pyruvate phosphate dikinase
MAPSEDDSSPRFKRRFFGAEESFTRIGSGELGGKASGLFLIHREILPGLAADAFPQIEVSIPTLTVLTTGFFDQFMDRNGLWSVALSDAPDDRLAHAFQKASLPAEFVGDLRALIAGVHRPLAIRSSSLLEDALEHPFAGVYGTKMIPNNQADVDIRFRRLVEAIKFVYATTFFRQAKDYIRSIGQDQRKEKMALVVQEVVGKRYGDRFYPTLSGVARSYNYYPSGRSEPEEGVVSLALGLGMQIVDGGLCWT